MNKGPVTHEEMVTEGLNIMAILRVLLRRIWIIALATVLCFGGVFLYSATMITPTYTSSFSAYVNNRISIEGVGSTSINDMNASMGLAYVYQEIIVSRSVLSEAAEKAGGEVTYAQLAGMVTSSISENAPVVTVFVESTDPALSAKLAQAIAETAPAHVKRVVEGSSMQVVDPPVEASSPSSPNELQNALVGALAGLVISAVAVVIIEIINDRVQSSEDLELRYHITVLGAIPDIEQALKNQKNTAYSRQGGKKV